VQASSPTARRRQPTPALTTAAIEMKWMNGWSASATFEGEFSNVTSSYAGKGVIRYQWRCLHVWHERSKRARSTNSDIDGSG